MDIERPNDSTLWSSRLEEPGALPGMGLTDKEASWDKLYDRLREAETPRRRSLVWLWAAAACLLLALIPAAFLLKEKNVTHPTRSEKIPIQDHRTMAATPKRTTPTPIAPLQSGSRQQPQEQDRTAVSQPRTTNAAHPHPTPAALHTATASRTATAQQTPSLATLPDTPSANLVFTPSPDLAQPLPLASNAVNKLAPKKEIRVVHINELEPPQPTPSTVMGQRRKPGRLIVNIIPVETFRPSTSYTEPSGHQLLSLKYAQNP